MKFELEETLRGASDEDILSEIRRVANFLGKNTVTVSEFREYGKCSPGTVIRRFGSWNQGIEKASLEVSVKKDITDVDLFKNLEKMWIQLGRQPRYSEVRSPFSEYSNTTYEKRFGKYSKALESFVQWINSEQEDEQEIADVPYKETSNNSFLVHKLKKRTRREISDRMRFRVLARDGFTCQSCGASPLKERGVELHVDHILPWSKGGETVAENLQTKCKQCNLGKGNAFDQ